MADNEKKWDVFVSHASEDKEDFVRPLAHALAQLGVKVWYDEFSLEVGDSLSRSIDKGLNGSRFGLVVLSESFINKQWPERELRGLTTREVEEGRTVILPIWLGISRKQVVGFSPVLADSFAMRADQMSAEDVAIGLLKRIRPDIYQEHPRAELEKMASGEALQELQDELEWIRDELAEYQCPHCKAPLSERYNIPNDEDFHAGDVGEEFQCGYRALDGGMIRPCPSDPNFPRFEDYDLELKESDGQWTCFARPKTKMAASLSLWRVVAWTEQEAKEQMLRRYESAGRKWKP
jgi:hypothetical protein